jgi:hypothetical protein
MTAVALPRQIVDQPRAERGRIVDTAIEMGRMVIGDQKVDGYGSSKDSKN